MIRLVLFSVLLLLMAVAIGAYTLIGLWAIVVVPVLVLAVGRFFMRPLLRELVLLPFKAKGAVLRGARVTFHSVRPATPPSDEMSTSQTSDADDGLARTFFHLDVTITPRARGATFTHWDPGELMLVRPEFVADGSAEDDACVISRVEVWQRDGFSGEEAKLEGAQRLRLLIGVQPPHNKLRLQYYFEQLGEIAIPSTMVPVPVRAATMPQ